MWRTKEFTSVNQGPSNSMSGTNDAFQTTRSKTPTGRRQTSWLFTSLAKELNLSLPELISHADLF